MGKGKKKGGKGEDPKEEEELPSVSVLSLGEQASTSAPPDEDEGLTGSSAKQRRQQKKAAAAAAKATATLAPATPAPAAVQPPEPVPTPEPASTQPSSTKEDDDAMEGLTGGGEGKKRRPRKKKATREETDEPRAAPVTSLPAPVVQPQLPTTGRGQTPPFQTQMQVPPPGFTPLQTPPAVRGQTPPFVRGQTPPFHAQMQTAPPGLIPMPIPPVVRGQTPPARQQQHQVPQHMQAPPPGYAPAAPGYAPAARGYAPAAPGYAPAAPSQQQPAPSPWAQRAPPSQAPSAPVQRASAYTKPAAPAPRAATSAQKPSPRASYRTEYVDCLHQIPKKILGKSVPAVPIGVLCNYLPMNIKPIVVHRYDVNTNPEKPKKMVPVAFYAFMKQHFPNILVAYDQFKNFYTTKPLAKVPPMESKEKYGAEVTVNDPNGRPMKFTVELKSTGSIDLGMLNAYMKNGTALRPPTEAIQCMDVILRQGSLTGYVKSGRTYFRRPTQPLKLGDGLEMWTGLFQSAIFTSRPFINIDVAHKGFPIQQPVISLMEEFRLTPQSPLDRQQNNAYFMNMMKGLKVVAFMGGDRNVKREFICNGVGDAATNIRFTQEDAQNRKTETTVADYFKKTMKQPLRYPHLNCLWVGPRDRNLYYPIELCEIAPNQVVNKQLNDRQLATIVREAATPPDIRMKKIKEIIQAMEYSRNPYFKEFGLQINENFTEVPARVLQAPKIKYKDGPPTFPKSKLAVLCRIVGQSAHARTCAFGAGPRQRRPRMACRAIKPRMGVWWMSKMFISRPVVSWMLLAMQRDVRQVNGEMFISMLKDLSGQVGITMSAETRTAYNLDLRGLEQQLCFAKDNKIQLVIVVVPSGRMRDNTNYYAEVKKLAERKVGVVTQCVKDQTLTRLSPQTVKNILLKINAKMTGVNHVLDQASMPRCLKDGGVMVVGADVTHPSPDQQSIPSIAAVTASMDPYCSVYSIGLSIQPAKQEMIVELEDIMTEHLLAYRQSQKALPRKIYMFRDGVSEGQYAQVLNNELPALYGAYRRVTGTDKKPEVLLCVVTKRHHTRLFQKQNDRYNVSPGTVVDTDIVHPTELDFYLVSHAAIKGTARPTRYYCLRNDGALPHDEVEQLAYYLCHLYSRCTRSVSYPTPTYYAHLACLRARALTHGEKLDRVSEANKPERLRVHENFKMSPMFFV